MRISHRWPFRRPKADEASASPSPVALESGSSSSSEIARTGATGQQSPQCWIYVIDHELVGLPESPTNGRLNKALAFVPPEFVRDKGLPGEAVYGYFAGDLTAEDFHPNRAFIDFMHRTIARTGPADPSMVAAGKQQHDGYVYVIDLRTPEGPQGSVPKEDIVGGFKVVGGVIMPDGYWANADHSVLTRHGPVRLPAALQDAMLSALDRVT